MSRATAILLVILFVIPAYAAPRIEQVLANGWRFVKKDVSGAETPGFDDRSWEPVTVPHTWNVDDGADGGNNYYRGPGWYRRHIQIGKEYAGCELFLRFGAASLVSDVYVNGSRVGHHEGGFGAFCYDVTRLLRDGDNVLAVRVDNTRNPNVTPLSGDFTIYGGLYRDVILIGTDPVHIDLLDDAGPGVYVSQTTNEGESSVSIRTLLRNNRKSTARIELRVAVFDERDKPVGDDSKTAVISPGDVLDENVHIFIANPHLWNGVRDPYLYKVRARLVEGDQVLDTVEQTIGLRFYRVDAEQGLLLNGKRYDMYGVNLHQGRPSAGWAATRRMQEEDYAIVSELGCTGVRMPHYQHAEYEHTLCDRYGLVTWAELALVNQVTDSPEFYANAKQQLRELIKQNYNHPSILFWSMYNEPSVDRKRGDNEWRLVKDLVSEAHSLDPGRLTTGAASMSGKEPLDWYMDIASFNRYWGWYSGEATDWSKGIDNLRREAGGRTFGISEYGAGASVKQHEINPKHPAPGGKWHPEEWQAEVHETIWPAIRDKQWMWCKLLWVMFDFPSDSRAEGDHGGINDKGLVTGDRKIRKDAFYYYKAQWSAKPFVYIADRRFTPRPAGVVDIKVYSNCDSVELWLNGKSLGARSGVDRVFRWPGVVLEGNEAEIQATAQGGLVDTIRWSLQKPKP